VTRLETLCAVRLAAQEAITSGDLPAFLGAVQQVCAEAMLDAAAPKASSSETRVGGRLLTVQEAAKRLGRSRWWVYRHKTTLPITRLPTGGFGFDARKLERWIESRSS